MKLNLFIIGACFTLASFLAVAHALEKPAPTTLAQALRNIDLRVDKHIMGDPPIQKVMIAWLQQWNGRLLADTFADWNETVLDRKAMEEQQQKLVELSAITKMMAARIEVNK